MKGKMKKAKPEAKHEEKEEKHHYKKGGKVKHHEAKVAGKKSGMRMDKKARGGKVGADSSPLTSANKVTTRPGFAASTTDKEDN